MTDLDFLDELLEEATAGNPATPELVAALGRRLDLIKALVQARRDSGLTQTDIAECMDTTQSAVARFETTASNPTFNTVESYAQAVGCRIEFSLKPIPVPSPVEKQTSKAR